VLRQATKSTLFAGRWGKNNNVRHFAGWEAFFIIAQHHLTYKTLPASLHIISSQHPGDTRPKDTWMRSTLGDGMRKTTSDFCGLAGLFFTAIQCHLLDKTLGTTADAAVLKRFTHSLQRHHS
jgi:hypothetical protein